MAKMNGNDRPKQDATDSKDEVDFIRADIKDSSNGGYQCPIVNKKRIPGTLYGDCEMKTSLKSSLSSLEKFSLFKMNPRKKCETATTTPPTKEKTKFVKSVSISRLLGNNYSTKKHEIELAGNCGGGAGSGDKATTENAKKNCNGQNYSSSSTNKMGGVDSPKIGGNRRFGSADRFQKYSKLEDMLHEVSLKEFSGDRDISAKALRTISRGLGKLWWKRTHSVNISTPDPEFKVSYLGNVLTGWAKGEGCVEKPLNSLWRNYTQNHKPDIIMRMRVSASGLKATTRQHGLTEYWANRITHCCAPKNYPRVFCWVYRHEGRKLKHEMRCHAVLCAKESMAQAICNTLRENLERALQDFKREKISKQNARLSLANAVYENPSLPRRKILLSVGGNNYRPPLERSKSAPKLMAIEEAIGEEDDEDIEQTNEPEMRACCQKDSLYPAMTLGRRRCRRGHSIRRTGNCIPQSIKSSFEAATAASPTKEIISQKPILQLKQLQQTSNTSSSDELTKALNGCHKTKSVSSLASDEDELDKLLSRNDYDISSPLSNELLSYFDMKLKPKTASLTNLQDLAVLFEPVLISDTKSRPRPALSLDNLDSYSDEGDEEEYDEDEDESDDTFYRQSAILNLLHRESLQKTAELNGMNGTNSAGPLFDSDEGSISSGCETASTVTANVDDSSLKYMQQQQQQMQAQQQDAALSDQCPNQNEAENCRIVKSNVRQTVVSFKLPNTNVDRGDRADDDGEVSDSEFSDESGYVEFQDNLILRSKSVAV